MQEQLAVQNLLRRKYEEIRAKNPQYSRRAFSKRAGLSPGAMSELLSGQRQVSRKLAEKLAANLGLDPQERAELLGKFPVRLRRGVKPAVGTVSPAQYLQLSSDQFRVIADWHHLAILSLVRTRDFRSEPAWIAARLGLPVSTVTTALERLLRLGLLEKGPRGKLSRGEARYRTSDDVSSASIRAAHAQYLNHALGALERLPVEARDFTSLMLPMDPARLARAKEMIRQFQDEFSTEVEAGGGSEVFQLCIQLFPLSRSFV